MKRIWAIAVAVLMLAVLVAAAFAEAEQLPAYSYTGEDPVEGAIAEFLATDERVEMYLTEPGFVSIPCPMLYKTEMIDDTHAKVYGTFWILNYVKKGNVLENISGGEYPAIITLEKTDDKWKVTSMEEAGDGEDYAADIRRFADGDQELEDQYFAGADLGTEENQTVRTRFIKAYVEANGLDVTAYKDSGWDPVELK